MMLRSMHYALDSEHNVVSLGDDLLVWAEMFEHMDRRVAFTTVRGPFGSQDVSTVFLGLDHNWSRKGPPIVFETMIFRGPLDGYQNRYATWDEAERGHVFAVLSALRARWNAWGWLKTLIKWLVQDFEYHYRWMHMGLFPDEVTESMKAMMRLRARRQNGE